MESDTDRNKTTIHPVLWIPKHSEIASAEELMQRLSITATSRDGETILTEGTIDEDRTSYMITLGLPEPFVPGMYTVKAVLSGVRGENRKVQSFFRNTEETEPVDITLLDQEIPWGLIALNTDRGTYVQGQQARVSLTVLDDSTAPLCNGTIAAEVTDPSGTVTFYNTKDGTITAQETCSARKFSTDSDYTLTIPLVETGEYMISVRATSEDPARLSSARTITRYVRVEENSEIIDVRRSMVTRTYPENTETMMITLLPTQTFVGTITEKVPADFVVTATNPPAAVEQLGDGSTFITWNREWTIGEPHQLSYTVLVPNTPARFSLFGVLTAKGIIASIQDIPLDVPRFESSESSSSVPSELSSSASSESQTSSSASSPSASDESSSTSSVPSQNSSSESSSESEISTSESSSSVSSEETPVENIEETPEEDSGLQAFLSSVLTFVRGVDQTSFTSQRGAEIAYAISAEPLTANGIAYQASILPPSLVTTGNEEATLTVDFEESREWELLSVTHDEDGGNAPHEATALTLDPEKDHFLGTENPTFRLLDIDFEESDGEILDGAGNLKDEKALTAIVKSITDTNSLREAIVESVITSEKNSIAESITQDSIVVNDLRSALSTDDNTIPRTELLIDAVKKTLDEQPEILQNLSEIVTQEKKVSALLDVLVTESVTKNIIESVVTEKLTQEDLSPEKRLLADESDISDTVLEELETQSTSLTNLTREAVGDAVSQSDDAKETITDAVIEPLGSTGSALTDIITVQLKQGDNDAFDVPYHFEKGSVLLVLDPVRNFAPGLYTLLVNIENPITGETQTLEQDFTWGVLAMNPDRDVYNTGDISHLSFGVLDDEGAIICDATLNLTITKPSGELVLLSTDDESIAVTGTCGKKEAFLIDPDYEAFFTMDETGTYSFQLDAIIENGTRSMLATLEAKDTVLPYSIQRTAATRLWPEAPSTMDIAVTFAEDFTGTITDILPSGFIVEATTPEAQISITSGGSATGSVVWSGSWSAGETVNFQYTYDAPDISPEFFLIGPLTLEPRYGDSYTEARSWQIANDDTSVKSVGTTANNATVGTLDWSSVGSPGNAGTSDNAYSTVSVAGTTKYLLNTNFGFSIPTGATIGGIAVSVEKKKTTGDGDVTHNAARIVKGGTIGSTDVTATWPTTEAVEVLGGATSLWGETWTAEDINASNFGFAISALVDDGGGPSATAYIDYISITVTYTTVAGSHSITGKVFTDEGTTNIGLNKTVNVSLNGGTSTSTDETDAAGQYVITGLTMTGGTIVTLYLDGETEKAVTVTLGSGSSMTGMHLYQNHVILRSESGSHAMTNAKLALADNVADTDVTTLMSVDASSILQIGKDKELYVWTGDTFTPGGKVFTHDVEVKGTMTMSTNTLIASGSLVANAGTFSTSSGILLISKDDDEVLNVGTNAIGGNIIMNSGMVGYWKFDEAEGSKARDTSYYGYDGTINFGTGSWSTTVPERIQFYNPFSLKFGGGFSTPTFVNMGNNYDQTGASPFTLSAWVRIPATPVTTYVIMGKQQTSANFAGYSMFLNTSSKLGFDLVSVTSSNQLQVTTTNALSANTWYHVLATYNEAKLRQE